MTWQDRFWAKVDTSEPDGCWPWAGARSGGYGLFRIPGQGLQLAHRISWELHYGPIPAGDGYHGTCVLHTCDNRPCIRPDHLFLGTQAENLADMARKGRGGERPLRGEDHGAAKLTWLEVAEIRALAGTMLQREIAARFGVSRPRISQIINGKTWHMTP